MDYLPLLPRSKSAWVACLVSTVILYYFYYAYLYPAFLESYKQQNLVILYTAKHNNSLTNNLDVHLIIPKSLGADPVQHATISIHNLKQETVHLKLRLIWTMKVKAEDVEGINRDLSVIGLIDTIEPVEGSMQVQPNSFGFVRLPLIFIGSSIKLQDELFILVTVLNSQGEFVGEEMLSAERETIPIVNRIKGSGDFILKKLLLPPLANVVLVGLAVILCWFFDTSQYQDQPYQDQPFSLRGSIMVLWPSVLFEFGFIFLFYFLEVKDYLSVVTEVLLSIVLIYIFKKREMLFEVLKEQIANIRRKMNIDSPDRSEQT